MIGSRLQMIKYHIPQVMIGASEVSPVDSVKDLGVVFDSGMTMEGHISAVCRSAGFYLRNIGKVQRYLTAAACERVVHALVTCRLDLNNALLVGLPQHLVARIQRCQNITALIVTCQKKTCHITPILMELHWLPVEFQIQYKVLLHVFRALNGLSPGYLAGMLECHVPTCSLRSTDRMLLTGPRIRHRWGDRAFSRAGPVLWNNLPLAMHSASSLPDLKGS